MSLVEDFLPPWALISVCYVLLLDLHNLFWLLSLYDSLSRGFYYYLIKFVCSGRMSCSS